MHSSWHPKMGDHKVSTDVHHEKRKKYEKRAHYLNVFLIAAAAVISLVIILYTLKTISG